MDWGKHKEVKLVHEVGERGRQNLHSASDRTCFVPCTHKRFRREEFFCRWTSCVEQFACRLATRHNSVHLSDNSKQYCLVGRDHVALWLFVSGAPYKYSYLLMAPWAWNSFSASINQSSSLTVFKRQLKTFLFDKSSSLCMYTLTMDCVLEAILLMPH